MKLLTSPTSPYGRKARIVLLENGLSHEVLNPWSADSGVALAKHNPLAKVPALLLDDGHALFDSVVIVEYADALGSARLIPTHPLERALVRRWEALADGVCDAAVSVMLERRKAEAQQSAAFIEQQLGKIGKALDFSDASLSGAYTHGSAFTLADAALVSALGYLDLRLGGEPWRESRPRLAAYAAALAERPSVAATRPPSS